MNAVPRAALAASLSLPTSSPPPSSTPASSSLLLLAPLLAPATTPPRTPTPTARALDGASITPRPSFEPGDEAQLVSLQQKWHLTTYWSCATFGSERVFCGWHEPVLPGGDEIAAASRRADARVAAVVAVAAVLVGAAL
ncbi:hypothetical protein JHW43_004835 [Diplocarpon mali]|nr:hypothetical protein JHW43_004835 [Diplocarpon mali]